MRGAASDRDIPPAPARPRLVVSALVLLVVAVAATWGPGAPPAAALEKVATGTPYGDFEDTHLNPVGWGVNAAGPNEAYTSSTVAMSGVRSLYVADTSASDAVSVMRKWQRVSPQAEYHLQAYAFVKSGGQSLALRFVDESNSILSRVVVPTPDATMVWSRVYVRAKAPTGAVAVTVEISSSRAGVGTAWWDTVEMQVSGVANSGFEAAADPTTPARDWALSAPAGTSIVRSTADSVLGRHSLETRDDSTTALVTARTTPKRVFPGAAQSVRIWLKPTSGQFTATVRFYDAAMRQVWTSTETIRKSDGRWNLYRRQVVPPGAAIWATVEFGSTIAGTGTSLWDAVDLRPTADSGVHSFEEGTRVQPVEQVANATAVTALVLSGRPKLVGVVSGYPAQLQVLDVQTGALQHRLPLGDVNVGWGLVAGRDGKVYVGGNDGHLWRWTPGSSSVVDLGRVSGQATTVWDLDVSDDGKIWGVSYPDAQIWSYDPAASAFSAATSVATGQEYARSLAVLGSSAFVGVGSTNPEIVEVSLGNRSRRSTISLPSPVTSGNITELDARGRFLAVKTPSGKASDGSNVASERRLFDTEKRTWAVDVNYPVQRPSDVAADGSFYYIKYRQLTRIDLAGDQTSLGEVGATPGRDKPILSATLGGVPGTWLLNYTPGAPLRAVEVSTLQEKSFDLDFSPTPLQVKTLARADGGFLAGGFGAPSLTALGADLTVQGHYPGSPSAPGAIGEVEGSVANGAVQYIGTYTNSRIFRYDTTKAWQDGTNPALVADLGQSHLQDRPLAWATSGPRTFFGTVPKYGTLGGVLGIIDADGATPRIVAEPVADQSVVSLAARGSVVYGGTSRWGGLGASPTQASAKVFAYDADTNRLLWSVTPQAGVEAYGALLVTPDGSLWAASGTNLLELAPGTGRVLRTLELQAVGPQPTPTLRNAAMDYADGLLYLTAAGRVYVVDLVSLRIDVPVKTGVTAFQIVAGDGRFVVPMGAELQEYRVH
jgi:hypothetical protein